MSISFKKLVQLHEGEKTIFLLRRHLLIFVGELIYVAILSAVPLGVWALISYMAPTLLTGPNSAPMLVLAASGYYLMVWLFLIGSFVDYYLDAWIVTDQRILNVEQHGIFSRTVSELDLSNVQDVTSEVHGVIPSIFGFGNVFVQTAGQKERFAFEQVSSPHEVRQRVLELVEAERVRETRIF